MKKIFYTLLFILTATYTASAQFNFDLDFTEIYIVGPGSDTLVSNEDTVDMDVTYSVTLAVVNNGPDSIPPQELDMMYSINRSSQSEQKDKGKLLTKWNLDGMAQGAGATVTFNTKFSWGDYTVGDSFNIVIIWPSGGIINDDKNDENNDYRMNLFVVDLASIANKASTIDFACYPVPATQTLNVQLNEKISNGILRLMDVNGKLVYSRRIVNGREGELMSIPLEGLAKGTYILNIDAGTATAAKTVVVTR